MDAVVVNAELDQVLTGEVLERWWTRCAGVLDENSSIRRSISRRSWLSASATALRRSRAGSKDHNIPVVRGVEDRDHFNTLIGYGDRRLTVGHEQKPAVPQGGDQFLNRTQAMVQAVDHVGDDQHRQLPSNSTRAGYHAAAATRGR